MRQKEIKMNSNHQRAYTLHTQCTSAFTVIAYLMNTHSNTHALYLLCLLAQTLQWMRIIKHRCTFFFISLAKWQNRNNRHTNSGENKWGRKTIEVKLAQVHTHTHVFAQQINKSEAFRSVLFHWVNLHLNFVWNYRITYAVLASGIARY